MNGLGRGKVRRSELRHQFDKHNDVGIERLNPIGQIEAGHSDGKTSTEDYGRDSLNFQFYLWEQLCAMTGLTRFGFIVHHTIE